MKLDLALIVPPLKAIIGQYARSSRSVLTIVAVTSVFGMICSVSAPYLFSRLVDRMTVPFGVEAVLWQCLFYAAIMGIGYALQRVASLFVFLTSERLSFVVSTTFFARLVDKTSAFFLDHNPTEIESAQQRGISALNIAAQFALSAILPSAVQLVLALGLLWTVLDLDIALVVLLYGCCYIGLVYRSSSVSAKHLDDAIELSQTNSRFVGNAIASMDTLRQFRSDRWMIDQFTQREHSVLGSFNRYVRSHLQYASIFGLALAAQFAVTLWILVPRVAVGELTVGDLVLFNTLLLQLNVPFQMVGQAVQQMAQSYSLFLPFARMWGAATNQDHELGGSFHPIAGAIVFDEVGYRYPNGRGVENTSFSAERGAITYLTGDTGAGKSTLFKLLLKSIAPTEGRIDVDGIDLASISRSDWFAHVAAVPQEIVLLNDTLATNIVLGRKFDTSRLRRACERAAILDFIDNLEDGFETIVGERGLKLSGGERQRIAIARALYEDPAILLLDEASSALDVETEKDIMDRLRVLRHDVTIIAITHRLSVIAPDDHVVRIGVAED